MRAIQPENKEEKQVNNQIQRQNSIISGLRTQMELLLEVLSPVLSDSEPSKESEDSSRVEVALCPLAGNIRDHNYQLKQINEAANDMVSRLEV